MATKDDLILRAIDDLKGDIKSLSHAVSVRIEKTERRVDALYKDKWTERGIFVAASAFIGWVARHWPT